MKYTTLIKLNKFICILAFLLLQVLTICGQQTTFFKADYFISNEKAQEQFYKIHVHNGQYNIQERGVFLSKPSIYAFAEAEIDSLGYSKVNIHFENGSINSYTHVERVNSNTYYSYYNGKVVDTLKIENGKTLLFDGPNPSFDVINRMILQKKGNNVAKLILINWIDGTLSTDEAYYINGKFDLAIHKQKTDRISFMNFDKDLFMPKTCYQNKESYVFEKIEKLPLEINPFKKNITNKIGK